MKNKVILVVAAHPDDEVLGCGATMARLSAEGNEVYTLIMGEGKTSRTESRNREEKKDEIDGLRREIKEANKILGVKETYIEDLPDNRFDSIDLLDIVKVVEKYKNKIKPDIIFTHFENDTNIDHQLLTKAVLTATRPIPDEVVKEVYSFEILSSTEWNYPLTFQPDFYIDVTKFMDKKIEAMNKYQSELREYPHTRSLEGIKINGKYWAMRYGIDGFVEVFKTLRRGI